ncbi:hypothetical protein LBMAG42_50310 [Deltaproteobacteria bacterium]|nr:hypothetical protein LBMAG42_50310 [Deltaproteobacteria bacterium]
MHSLRRPLPALVVVSFLAGCADPVDPAARPDSGPGGADTGADTDTGMDTDTGGNADTGADTDTGFDTHLSLEVRYTGSLAGRVISVEGMDWNETKTLAAEPASGTVTLEIEPGPIYLWDSPWAGVKYGSARIAVFDDADGEGDHDIDAEEWRGVASEELLYLTGAPTSDAWIAGLEAGWNLIRYNYSTGGYDALPASAGANLEEAPPVAENLFVSGTSVNSGSPWSIGVFSTNDGRSVFTAEAMAAWTYSFDGAPSESLQEYYGDTDLVTMVLLGFEDENGDGEWTDGRRPEPQTDPITLDGSVAYLRWIDPTNLYNCAQTLADGACSGWTVTTEMNMLQPSTTRRCGGGTGFTLHW